jgi:hypothetical protein
MLQAPAPLTVRGVFKALHSVAAEKGAGAANRRKQIILRLLRSCRRGPSSPALPGPPCERKASSTSQCLRARASWCSMVPALACMAAA